MWLRVIMHYDECRLFYFIVHRTKEHIQWSDLYSIYTMMHLWSIVHAHCNYMYVVLVISAYVGLISSGYWLSSHPKIGTSVVTIEYNSLHNSCKEFLVTVAEWLWM